MSAQIDNVLRCARMDEAHLDGVAAIEQVVHVHPWTRGNFADSITAGYECWVAHQAGTLVGYGVLLVAAAEAHLLNLSVAPQWQRRGIGAELTRFFVSLARNQGAAKIYLEVRPSNTPARALYAANGFVEIGVRRGYYPAPEGREDALVMELSL
jgi:ribosomal-protein-alanine N-acetyltransferase